MRKVLAVPVAVPFWPVPMPDSPKRKEATLVFFTEELIPVVPPAVVPVRVGAVAVTNCAAEALEPRPAPLIRAMPPVPAVRVKPPEVAVAVTFALLLPELTTVMVEGPPLRVNVPVVSVELVRD